jgi:hypothetical protein
MAEDVAQVATPSTQPAVSLESFISSMKLTLEEPLASSPIRRVLRVDDSVFVPRRSVRLAAKAIHRDPIPEKQEKRVLLSKWTHADTGPGCCGEVSRNVCRAAFRLQAGRLERAVPDGWKTLEESAARVRLVAAGSSEVAQLVP